MTVELKWTEGMWWVREIGGRLAQWVERPASIGKVQVLVLVWSLHFSFSCHIKYMLT